MKGEEKKKKKKELYFNSDTQAAIEAHQVCSSSNKRELIFMTRIYPAFEKLVENLINIHKFTGQYDSHEDLKSDCITFLYESMHKFDPDRGTNAFSYFNIVAKRWLIIKSKKKLQNQKKFASLSDLTSMTNDELETVDHYSIVPSQDTAMIVGQKNVEITDTLLKIRSKLKNSNEFACIDAIITIFEMIDNIDMLNKSAVLLYIREISGLTPKQLTMAMYNVKKTYRELHGNDPLAWDILGG